MDEHPDRTSEALTKGLAFGNIYGVYQDREKETFTVFDYVARGKIVELNEFMLRIDQRYEIQAGTTQLPNRLYLLKRVDEEDKNLLFYAVHHNYHNLILYLLDYGMNPFHRDVFGRTIFHHIGYQGLLESAQLILNYLLYLHRHKLFKLLKGLKAKYRIKKSDVANGVAISTEKNLPAFRERFEGFIAELSDVYDNYMSEIYRDYFEIVTLEDTNQRTPIHWAALAKFTKCERTIKCLLDPENLAGFQEFEHLWTEIENLKLSQEPSNHPKNFLKVETSVTNFLSPEAIQTIQGRFRRKMAELQGKVINRGDDRGLTPLHLASFASQHHLCDYLIELGAKKDVKDMLSKTALNYSSNAKVRKAFTNLAESALAGDLYSFEYLLHAGCNINERHGLSAISPLHNAVLYSCKNKDMAFLNIVLKCGADINLSDINGWTPLHYAAREGNRDVASFLIDNGADVNKFSGNGLYPVHVAAQHNSVEIIDLMAERKVFIDVRDDIGCSPFLLAAKKGHREAMDRLLRYGAYLYNTDKWKWTALHHASYLGLKKIVQFLASADADDDKLRRMTNSQGKTAFKLAHDEDTRTALNTVWFAAKTGKLDILRKLHTLGHDINQPTNRDRRTPLMLAAMNGHLLVAKYLLDHHADEKMTDIHGRYAVYYARQKIPDQANKRPGLIDNPVKSLFSNLD